MMSNELTNPDGDTHNFTPPINNHGENPLLAYIRTVESSNNQLKRDYAEQAAEIANLKTLAQAVVARHKRKIIIGDLSSYEMDSEELENLAKALEVDDE